MSFGRPDGPVPGLAPGCRALIVPIFTDWEGHLSQRDLARAVDQAVEAGTHVIKVSGGQKAPASEAEDLLAPGRRHARDQNVLIVAAAGNDGCACLRSPRRGGVHRGGALWTTSQLFRRIDHDHDQSQDERARPNVPAAAAGPGRPGAAGPARRRGNPVWRGCWVAGWMRPRDGVL